MNQYTDNDGELPRPSDFTAPHACAYCGIQLPLLGLVLRHEERCPMRPANVLEALVQDVQARRMADAHRGYYGIGVYAPKTEENIGTLWRSAYQLGAAFIFTIAHRYKPQASDTCKAWRNIPLHQLPSWEAFQEWRPYDCPLVAIELGGECLSSFTHPQRACYLLGAEDGGIPQDYIHQAQAYIEIESLRHFSFNVSVAGSLVMYDRMIKAASS